MKKKNNFCQKKKMNCEKAFFYMECRRSQSSNLFLTTFRVFRFISFYFRFVFISVCSGAVFFAVDASYSSGFFLVCRLVCCSISFWRTTAEKYHFQFVTLLSTTWTNLAKTENPYLYACIYIISIHTCISIQL